MGSAKKITHKLLVHAAAVTGVHITWLSVPKVQRHIIVGIAYISQQFNTFRLIFILALAHAIQLLQISSNYLNVRIQQRRNSRTG